MRRLAALLGSCVIGLFLLTGCGSGGGDNHDDDSGPGRLVGSWRATRIASNGLSTNCAGQLNFVEDNQNVTVTCGSNDTFSFFEDGSFSGSAEESGPFAGTYQYNNDTLTVTVTTPSTSAGTQSERISFSGDNTFSSTTSEGVTITFERLQ